MKTINTKGKLITICIYVLIFMIILCAMMFFIKNNMNGQMPNDFQEIVDKGGIQEYQVTFMGVLMQSTIVTIEDSGVIVVDKVNFPGLFYMPIILTVILTSVIIVIVSKVKKQVSKQLI